MTVAAMVTNISLLNAAVLASTRMPFAMADDGYLPRVLTGVHPRFGTPWVSIIASAAVYGLLSVLKLTQLISVYSWLRIATTILTVLAGWQLRRKRPDMGRPFRIPGGRKGLMYAVAAPVVMSVLALLGSDRFGLTWGAVSIAVGPLVYIVIRRRPLAARL
jgi:amino acid transporter